MLRFRAFAAPFIIAFILLSAVAAFGANITYTYDNLNRLIKADYGYGSTEEFTYDAAGNRLTYVMTADVTPPIDGLLFSNPGITQITLSWTAATDSGSGLSSAGTYKLVKEQGSTPPANCLGTAAYQGAVLSYTDTGLTNGQTYSYRLCAYDNAGNVSAGVTVTIMTLIDTDSDGMADAWEMQHFDDLSRNGTGDLDGDGVNDYQEYMDGTDPASCLWSEVNGTHLNACVNHSSILKNCLAEARNDGTHNNILVVQGIYRGNFTYGALENFDLSLYGGYAAGCGTFVSKPELTVLDGDTVGNDGSGDGVVLALDASAGSGSILVEGFTIINGLNSINEGGGIRALTNIGRIDFIGNFITDNQATFGGGGIGANSALGDISLINNIIQSNKGDYGAGALAGSEAGNIGMINNIITDNLAAYDGGGLATATTTGSILLLNNTIAHNDALSDDGGGIAVLLNSDTATADITYNIIWGNTTGTGTCQDIYIDSDYDNNTTHATVILNNNDFNQTSGICTTNPAFSLGAGNINVDAQFVNAAGGDYHLIFNSPMINLGNSTHPALPSVDVDGNTRIVGSGVDIGADEVATGVPTLISPVYTITTTTPTYIWTAVSGATEYQLSLYNYRTAQTSYQWYTAAEADRLQAASEPGTCSGDLPVVGAGEECYRGRTMEQRV